MKKWNLPLTYQPKIQSVIDGTCRQTIRIGRKFSVGDVVRFYVWECRPYHSKRRTVTEYAEITTVKNCRVSADGIDDMEFQGEFGLWGWSDLDTLAELDGIVPPTGFALRDVLMSKNPLTSDWVDAQIIRW